MRIISHFSIVIILSLAGSVLPGCGGNGNTGIPVLTPDQEVATGVMAVMASLVTPTGGLPSLSLRRQAVKSSGTTHCPGGGTLSIGPAGEITFTNCTFSPDTFLDGTLAQQTNPDGSSTLLFQNFEYTGPSTTSQFSGTYLVQDSVDGSTTVQTDVLSNTQLLGGQNSYTISGSMTLDGRGNLLVGPLSLLTGNTQTQCNFAGQNLQDFLNQNQAFDVVDQDCGDPLGL